MNTSRMILVPLNLIAVALASVPVSAAVLAQATIDRKFPQGSFCPIESRGSNLVHFFAPSNAGVVITFTADNFFGEEGFAQYNAPRIDNVMLLPRTLFEAHLAECAGCFNHEPLFPSDSATVAPLVEFFDTDPTGAALPIWSGGSWDATRSAPKGDSTATECDAGTGGCLLLGVEAQGPGPVSATVTASGLTPGVEYVVFAWYFVYGTDGPGCSGFPGCAAPITVVVEDNPALAVESAMSWRHWGRVKASYRSGR